MRALVLVALVTGCGAQGSFACSDDDDCAGVAGGACEATGVCSFPDDACESGRRYGEWAGGLAMSCVPVDAATGSTSVSTDDDGDTVTLTDPTTLTTSATLTATSSVDTGETTSPIDPDTSTSTFPPTSTDDTATTGEPLDPDLVAWYRFEEDEIDGTVIDEVGLHDGACDADQCPLVIEGAVGKAAEFDGIDDIVRVALSDLLVVDAQITVALWVRIDVADEEFRTFASKAYGAMVDDTWELGLAGTEIQFILMVTPLEFESVGSGAAPLATWVHAAGVWDGEVIRLYLDGALIGETVATEIVQDDHDITLGAGNDFGTDQNFLDGALDEVRIYRRALAEDEIAALAVAP
jgi:hypothetical protein